jgi:phytoene synthase
MMAVVMGMRDDDVVARACDLGVAMQLTNIARDVGEDARNGRLYLPRRWMRDEGIDPDEWLARPSFSRPLAAVVRRLLAHADELYQRADAGIACLPSLCRPGIRAARRLYAEIGHEVARRGFDSVSDRAVVPPGRKISLLARSVIGFPHSRDLQQAPALDEVRFLVEAATGSQTAPSAGSRSRSLETRIIWVLALFERLERREQMSGGT